MSFTEELKWRGMLQDIMPGTEELLNKEMVAGYIGFDPTADSLHVGSLIQIMILKRFQQAGHKPIALVGGATGMIGDPSGKKEERKLLTVEDIEHNINGIKKQLEKFLDFDSPTNPAEIVNNNDWFKDIHTIAFLRDVGKYLTVNYLLSKGFVKDRINSGQELSFTEFNYILMQAYDFLFLYQNKNCKIQMGGSDQWGNITAGSELIRKKLRGDAYALTCPLMTKADGTKFGKTETGNIWLDRNKTSPYAFYQFWLNASDEDAKNFIRVFTLFNKQEIETMETEHAAAPHLRILQKALAKEVTVRVHSENDYNKSVEISEVFFNGSADDLKKLSADDLESVHQSLGNNSFTLTKTDVANGIPVLDLLATATQIFPSKSEAKKMMQANGVALNKEKLTDINATINSEKFVANNFLVIQKGKKNFFMIKCI